MSSPYDQSHHPIYDVSVQNEVQWVWVPVPIKVLPVAQPLTPGSPLPDIYPNHALVYTPSSLVTPSQVPPSWDQGTAPISPSQFLGSSVLRKQSPGLGLAVTPREPALSGGSFTAPAPMELSELDQYVDVPPLPADFTFTEPWAYPTTIPGQDTDSLGTIAPVDTPPAQVYMMQPYPRLLPCPVLDCFDTFFQIVDVPHVSYSPHTLKFTVIPS